MGLVWAKKKKKKSNRTRKASIIKEKFDTLDYIKIRSFSIKVIIWTVNRQPMDKKKIFARQTHLVLL